MTRLRLVPPPCCDLGAKHAPGHCPWHDRWRHVTFLAPPDMPDDEEDDE